MIGETQNKNEFQDSFKATVDGIICSYILIYFVWISWSIFFYNKLFYQFQCSVILSIGSLGYQIYKSWLQKQNKKDDIDSEVNENILVVNISNNQIIQTQILEKIVIGTGLILLNISYSLKLNELIYYLPMFTIITIFLRLRMYYIKKESQECATFYNFFVIFIQFSIAATISTVYLKMLNNFNFSCKTAYWPLWILFSINVGINFAILLVFMNRIFQKMMSTSIVEKDEIIGLSWVFLMSSGLSISLVFFCLGMIDLCNDSGFSQLRISIIILLTQVSVFLLYSILIRKQIFKFFIILSQTEDSENEDSEQQEDQNQLQSQNKLKQIKYNTMIQLKITHSLPFFLLKLNNTYFKRTNSNDFDKIQKQINQIKKKKLNPKSIKQQNINNQKPILTPIESIPSNRKSETNMITDTGNINYNYNLPTLGPQEGQLYFTDRELPLNIIQVKQKGQLVNEVQIVCQQPQGKKNNIYDTDNQFVESKSQSQINDQNSDISQQNCLICYDKQPDCVFLDCGHGGICFSCGKEIQKKSNECFLCRNPIVQILKLDLGFTDNKHFKVIQAI